MSTSHATLKLFRQIHLWVGIFISPALLFFAFTGALQTFSFHETTPGSSYKPPSWLVTLGQIHKKQTTIVPVRKPRPDAGAPDASAAKTDHPETGDRPKHDRGGREIRADKAANPDPAATAPMAKTQEAPKKGHLPLKIFFLLVSIGLFTSTLTGIYMAYKFSRGKVLVTALLIAGVVIPLLLLPF